SIPCLPECKIVGQILLDHPLSYALTATADVSSVYLQQFWKTMSKDFMNYVFYKKNAIQYLRFTKLIIVDLMKKFPNIPQRIDVDYHSIKDDIPLVIQLGMCEKDEQSYDDVDDFDNRLEPGSHKENPQHVDDDDDKEEEKVDDQEGDEIGSLETRTDEMQTPIPTTLRSPRINLSSDKNITQELTDTVSLSTPTTSKDEHSKRCTSSKYIYLPSALHRMCMRQGYMIKNMERKCVTTDYFWKTHKKFDQVLHEIVPQLAERATDDLIENNLKPFIDKDEVIPKDETPELITKFQNVDKRVPTIFDRVRMEATLNDMLSNQFKNAEEYAYHLEQATNFMDNQIVWESKQKDIVKFCNATLEKVLKEVKVKIFQSEPWKKRPMLDILLEESLELLDSGVTCPSSFLSGALVLLVKNQDHMILSLGDDASKQGRIDIGDINTDAAITLIDETQGRINDIIADEDITLIS
ncbi:hypothetical protein Tco_0644572, partial [Tanacetum coccineum]